MWPQPAEQFATIRPVMGLAGKEDKVIDLIAEKQRILNAKPNSVPDDLKPASGEIYNACKTILSLENPGNNTKTFMRDMTCPPRTGPHTMLVLGRRKGEIWLRRDIRRSR